MLLLGCLGSLAALAGAVSDLANTKLSPDSISYQVWSLKSGLPFSGIKACDYDLIPSTIKACLDALDKGADDYALLATADADKIDYTPKFLVQIPKEFHKVEGIDLSLTSISFWSHSLETCRLDPAKIRKAGVRRLIPNAQQPTAADAIVATAAVTPAINTGIPVSYLRINPQFDGEVKEDLALYYEEDGCVPNGIYRIAVNFLALVHRGKKAVYKPTLLPFQPTAVSLSIENEAVCLDGLTNKDAAEKALKAIKDYSSDPKKNLSIARDWPGLFAPDCAIAARGELNLASTGSSRYFRLLPPKFPMPYFRIDAISVGDAAKAHLKDCFDKPASPPSLTYLTPDSGEGYTSMTMVTYQNGWLKLMDPIYVRDFSPPVDFLLSVCDLEVAPQVATFTSFFRTLDLGGLLDPVYVSENNNVPIFASKGCTKPLPPTCQVPNLLSTTVKYVLCLRELAAKDCVATIYQNLTHAGAQNGVYRDFSGTPLLGFRGIPRAGFLLHSFSVESTTKNALRSIDKQSPVVCGYRTHTTQVEAVITKDADEKVVNVTFVEKGGHGICAIQLGGTLLKGLGPVTVTAMYESSPIYNTFPRGAEPELGLDIVQYGLSLRSTDLLGVQGSCGDAEYASTSTDEFKGLLKRKGLCQSTLVVHYESRQLYTSVALEGKQYPHFKIVPPSWIGKPDWSLADLELIPSKPFSATCFAADHEKMQILDISKKLAEQKPVLELDAADHRDKNIQMDKVAYKVSAGPKIFVNDSSEGFILGNPNCQQNAAFDMYTSAIIRSSGTFTSLSVFSPREDSLQDYARFSLKYAVHFDQTACTGLTALPVICYVKLDSLDILKTCLSAIDPNGTTCTLKVSASLESDGPFYTSPLLIKLDRSRVSLVPATKFNPETPFVLEALEFSPGSPACAVKLGYSSEFVNATNVNKGAQSSVTGVWQQGRVVFTGPLEFHEFYFVNCAPLLDVTAKVVLVAQVVFKNDVPQPTGGKSASTTMPCLLLFVIAFFTQ